MSNRLRASCMRSHFEYMLSSELDIKTSVWSPDLRIWAWREEPALRSWFSTHLRSETSVSAKMFDGECCDNERLSFGFGEDADMIL